MPTSELPHCKNAVSVQLGKFTFALTRQVQVSIVAETKEDAEELFCLVFGDMLYSQVKSIY